MKIIVPGGGLHHLSAHVITEGYSSCCKKWNWRVKFTGQFHFLQCFVQCFAQRVVLALSYEAGEMSVFLHGPKLSAAPGLTPVTFPWEQGQRIHGRLASLVSSGTVSLLSTGCSLPCLPAAKQHTLQFYQTSSTACLSLLP